IYIAITEKSLKATKGSKKWNIKLDDLEEYNRKKYSRSKSMYKGELKFDNSKGFYSVQDVAKLLNLPEAKIYYSIYMGRLKYEKKGSSYVIYIDDIQKFKET